MSLIIVHFMCFIVDNITEWTQKLHYFIMSQTLNHEDSYDQHDLIRLWEVSQNTSPLMPGKLYYEWTRKLLPQILTGILPQILTGFSLPTLINTQEIHWILVNTLVTKSFFNGSIFHLCTFSLLMTSWNNVLIILAHLL